MKQLEKRILILCMSCQDPFFTEQEKMVESTWGKDILEGKYPNIDLYFYRGGYNSNTMFKDHKLFLHVEDDIYNTFKKTYCALNILNKKLTFDYVLRTNTSTFVNVKLLNAFVQSLNNDDEVWAGDIISLSNEFAPYPLCLYGRGNSLLLSCKHVNLIIDQGISFLYSNIVDDTVIGNILNANNIIQGKDYLKYIKNYKHAWFRCINDPQKRIQNGHSLCQWNNEDGSFDFMKHFITIQIKRYWEREKENQNYIDLYEKCFKDAKYKKADLNACVKEQYEYAESPNVFIGSILGYIDYHTWYTLYTKDRQKLYDIQVTHKSADDPSRGKNKDLILL